MTLSPRVVAVYICVFIVAGLIAYLGNQLGRYIGKRKMSLLRMRPRNTSIVITSLTGALIAVATLTLFASFSEPVRALLGGVEDLKREEARLRSNVKELERTIAEGTFVWTKGEPIVHMTLPSGLPEERTRLAITGLLTEANIRTILANNKISAERKETPLPITDVYVESSSENLSKALGKLAHSNGVMGIKIVAQSNCLYREKAPVSIEVWPVKLVFKKDEVVFRQEISSHEVVTDFFKFVEEMRKTAKKRGMLPIDGRLGGGISQREFNILQEEMGRQEGTFFLVAKARRDLYETNSLDVSISVEPVKEEPKPQEEYGGW